MALYIYIRIVQVRCKSWVHAVNDARGGMEKEKHISHNLLDSVLHANETLALPFTELAQMLYATLSGIVDSILFPGGKPDRKYEKLKARVIKLRKSAAEDNEEDSPAIKKAICSSSNSGFGFQTQY